MAQRIRLNDGRTMPTLGLGTWPMDDAEAERVVALALELGYRHIDTAVRYGNERGVGRGIAASGLPRDEVFVTTKVDGEHQGGDRAVDGLRGSLDRLGLEYVDLLLIHWPLPARDLYVDTWRTFERLRDAGLARSIGVSNFKPAHLERLARETETLPAVNQVQLNPYVTREDHRRYHDEHGIVTVSYSPSARAGRCSRTPSSSRSRRRTGARRRRWCCAGTCSSAWCRSRSRRTRGACARTSTSTRSSSRRRRWRASRRSTRAKASTRTWSGTEHGPADRGAYAARAPASARSGSSTTTWGRNACTSGPMRTANASVAQPSTPPSA